MSDVAAITDRTLDTVKSLRNATPSAASASFQSMSDEDLLNSRTVRRQFGDITEMTLWRWIHSDVNFPAPVKINGRNYWARGDLRRYREKLTQTA